MSAKYTEKDLEEDLTAARDERCVPVAIEVIKLMSEHKDGLLGSKANPDKIKDSYNQLAKDILSLLVEKEVLVSETPFIEQLLMQMFENSMGVVRASLNISLKELERIVIGKEVRDLSLAELDKLLKGEKIVVQ